MAKPTLRIVNGECKRMLLLRDLSPLFHVSAMEAFRPATDVASGFLALATRPAAAGFTRHCVGVASDGGVRNSQFAIQYSTSRSRLRLDNSIFSSAIPLFISRRQKASLYKTDTAMSQKIKDRQK
jgi:hypothetical protein